MSGRLFFTLPEAEQRIEWILAHPNVSDWLKDSLRKALDRDPVDVVNDMELLRLLLHPWAEARIDQLLGLQGNMSAEWREGI